MNTPGHATNVIEKKRSRQPNNTNVENKRRRRQHDSDSEETDTEDGTKETKETTIEDEVLTAYEESGIADHEYDTTNALPPLVKRSYQVWDIQGDGNCGYYAIIVGMIKYKKLQVQKGKGFKEMIKMRRDTKNYAEKSFKAHIDHYVSVPEIAYGIEAILRKDWIQIIKGIFPNKKEKYYKK